MKIVRIIVGSILIVVGLSLILWLVIQVIEGKIWGFAGVSIGAFFAMLGIAVILAKNVRDVFESLL